MKEVFAAAVTLASFTGSNTLPTNNPHSQAQRIIEMTRELCEGRVCHEDKIPQGTVSNVFVNKLIHGADVQYQGDTLNSANISKDSKFGFSLSISVGSSTDRPKYGLDFYDDALGLTATISFLDPSASHSTSSGSELVSEDILESEQKTVGVGYDTREISLPQGKEKGSVDQSPVLGIHSQNSPILANTVLYMIVNDAEQLVNDINADRSMPSLGQFTVWAKQAEHLATARGL